MQAIRFVKNTKIYPKWCSSFCTKNVPPPDSPEATSVPEKHKTDTNKRLNQLLADMAKVSSNPKLELAKPKGRTGSKRSKNSTKVTKEIVDPKIVTAVKNVASSIGGDVKQTESELITKLLKTTHPDNEPLNLIDVVKGMKIDTSDQPVYSRAHQVRTALTYTNKKERYANSSQYKRKIRPPAIQSITVEPINIFEGEPLGIFTKDSIPTLDNQPKLSTWERLEKRELYLAVTHPPKNYFQKLIQWTDEGKLWKFPIDNEQDMEEERNVCFTEHVFLEKHLEGWCPAKGPVRHFMELVCVGLSKNPYMSVETKRGHIEWYRNYFEDKKKVLQETGAYPAELSQS